MSDDFVYFINNEELITKFPNDFGVGSFGQNHICSLPNPSFAITLFIGLWPGILKTLDKSMELF